MQHTYNRRKKFLESDQRCTTYDQLQLYLMTCRCICTKYGFKHARYITSCIKQHDVWCREGDPKCSQQFPFITKWQNNHQKRVEIMEHWVLFSQSRFYQGNIGLHLVCGSPYVACVHGLKAQDANKQN